MKYLVTYCAMDHQLEGNPFWHSCILLSQFNENQKIEVVDNWGFYGLPSTTRDNWLSKLKIKIGLDVDFKGNHGVLRHEELRFMDLGYALHGVTFELSEEQFNQLQQRCQKAAKSQSEAIEEIARFLHLEPKKNPRIYPYEDHSQIIYAAEKLRAKMEKRPSRLEPFEINPTMTLGGPALNKSLNCKTRIIALLTGILTEEQIQRITEDGKHPTVPRLSGPMEKIFLHSSGPVREHTKASGEVVYFRDLEDRNVTLHWTLPPQEIEAINEDTCELLRISDEYSDDIKNTISSLQRLEWLFFNAKFNSTYTPYQNELVARIRECYEDFSYLKPKKKSTHISQWGHYFFSLFSLPKDENENILQEKLLKAKDLINSLYMAVVDGWKIHDDCLPETEAVEESEDNNYYNPLEALAAYLPLAKQKQLCAIIGRRYDPPADIHGPAAISMHG